MFAIAFLFAFAQCASCLSVSPAMYTDGNQDVLDDIWPHDFKPTWQMPKLARSRLSSDVYPIRVHDASLVVLGMAKDISSNEVPRLRKVAGLCNWFDTGSCHIRVLVGDVDPVLQAELEGEVANLRLIIDPHSGTKKEKRTIKYARLRNFLLEKGLEVGTQYVMVADMDDIVQWDDTTIGAVTNVLAPAHRNKWDGVAFVSDNYYDWWALRCNRTSPNCWATIPVTCSEPALFSCLGEAMTPSGVNFIPVDSAFNGIALYRTNQIGDCKYDGWSHPYVKHGFNKDCEHVAFTRCMVSHGAHMMLSSLSIHNSYTAPCCDSKSK